MATDEIVSVLKRILGFRYKDHGYGSLSCRSCGAKASVNYDPYKITREACSKTCPWHLLETYYLELLNDNKS